MTSRLVVIDTVVGLLPARSVEYAGATYHGVRHQEHGPDDAQSVRDSRLLSSADNTFSFWFTRPSLVNLITRCGFSSVFECFTPAHINLDMPRCTFVAVKAAPCPLHMSPAANDLKEMWPEGSLTYKP